ncbi:MAG: AAA family ATPase [Anaerolineales bacterium]
MLKELYLQNFRCFDKHTLDLKPTSVIVGINNAGKSTTIEALRILSLVMNRYGFLNFLNVPNWLIDSDMPVMERGVSPSLRGIEFNALSIFHNLGKPPALIRGVFDEGFLVEIYIGPQGAIHAIIKDQEHHPILNKSKAQKVLLPKINILPQIAPLSTNELILDPDYVRSVTSTSWASQHFRNQLLLYPEYFNQFKTLAEATWPNLKILGLEKRSNNPREPLAFFVQDHDFVAEISWMGHGLQMWLQTMWFLARSRDSATIILDEPDVYMHADLQRKLIRILKDINRQVVVATHSVEIMAEVEAQDVLVINRLSSKSVYASSIPSVQKVIDNIGGIHNIQLARLWNSQKCLFVEGKDIAFLKALQNLLFPRSNEAIDTIPNLQLGGWGGWNFALGSKLLLKNAIGENIKAYCIFDSDFHTQDEIDERYKQAQERDIQLHVWDKKEIENYFIRPLAKVS